jgi:hypothetical protein
VYVQLSSMYHRSTCECVAVLCSLLQKHTRSHRRSRVGPGNGGVILTFHLPQLADMTLEERNTIALEYMWEFGVSNLRSIIDSSS